MAARASRAARGWSKVKSYVAYFGVGRGLVQLARLRLVPRRGLVHVSGGKLLGPVTLRAGSADVFAMEDVLLGAALNDLKGLSPRCVVDAGANIGFASIRLQEMFPDAEIVAVEAESENFKLLCQNTRAYPRIRPVHAAIWPEPGVVSIQNPNEATWSFYVGRTGAGEVVEALPLDLLMARFALPRIDLLKLDIEGGEYELFSRAVPWLSKVDVMLVEMHDRKVPGCTQALEQMLVGVAHTKRKVGEYLCVRMLDDREGRIGTWDAVGRGDARA